MSVLCYDDILMLRQFIPCPEIQHRIEGHGGGHHDLDIPELIDMLYQFFCFMLAMVALRVEDHQHHRFLFIKILLGKERDTVR